uniref:Uncharacterized protein n=1 Tax=Globodera rostochiensis TaxID=31243 RepID=A0A914H7T8_GLORO
MDCFAEAEHGCVVKGEGTIHTTSAAREDSDELGMALATGCELIRDIKKDAQFEKAGLSIGQLGQVVADACAEQNAKGFEQHELRLIQTLATNEFDAYLNNELAHGPLKDGLNELLRAKEHLLPSDLLAFLLNKINTFGHNQEGIGGGKWPKHPPKSYCRPSSSSNNGDNDDSPPATDAPCGEAYAAFAFVITGLLARNMGMIVLGYWLFFCWWILGFLFVLLVLCIGVAIEQSQTYMLGYGSVYGYGYPYGGWYGKRQAGLAHLLEALVEMVALLVMPVA